MVTLNELSEDKVTIPDDKMQKILGYWDNIYMKQLKYMGFMELVMVTITMITGRPNWLQILLICISLFIYGGIVLDRILCHKSIKAQHFRYIAIQEIRSCRVYHSEILCSFGDEGLYNGTAVLIEGHLYEKGDKIIVFSIDGKKFWCV